MQGSQGEVTAESGEQGCSGGGGDSPQDRPRGRAWGKHLALIPTHFTFVERVLLKTFQNLRVSSPAPVTMASPSGDMACRRRPSVYLCPATGPRDGVNDGMETLGGWVPTKAKTQDAHAPTRPRGGQVYSMHSGKRYKR